MRICSIDRETLLDWLAGKFRPNPVKLTAQKLKAPLNDDIALIFDDNDDQNMYSPILSVPGANIPDFYAFVNTYAAQYKPFSAFLRVIPYEQLLDLTNCARSSRSANTQKDALIGVAIAEVYAQSRGRLSSIDRISISAVEATLSATLSEAVQQGFSSDKLADITKRWILVRRLENSEKLHLESEKVLQIWEIVADAISPKLHGRLKGDRRKIVSALREMQNTALNPQGWFLPLASEVPRLAEELPRMSRSREERVRSSKEILSLLRESKLEPLVREFLAGAVLSMVGNGSFQQLPILEDLLSDMPAAALWFGVVSSFQSSNDALMVGNCLGRRVVRDMRKDSNLFSEIEGDISVEELKLLRDDHQSGNSFRAAQPGSIKVNLFGNVSGRFKTRQSNQKDGRALDLESKVRENIREIEELRDILDRASYIGRRLAAARQRDLFE